MHTPYAPPQASLDTPQAYASSPWYSPKGRIGRVRYLLLALGLLLLATPLLLVHEWLKLFGAYGVAWLPGAALALVYLGGGLLISAKRIHDIGWSAWWLLLYLLPGANSLLPLLLACMPGTAGSNAYGLPPPPNSLLTRVLACLLVLAATLLVIGLLAGKWLLHSLFL